VADSASRSVWSFQVLADGTLANGQPFYRLVLPDEGALKANADGMVFDDQGFLYVATYQGIQICDQPGRVVAIIGKPSAATPSNVVIGGPDMRTLYVTAGDKVFARHLRRKGFHPWQPVKPPVPQL
jgi:gluconolactonase